MSCCGQKRNELKPSSASAPRTTQAVPLRVEVPGRVRPREPRGGNVALIDYLTRNSKLFGGR